MSEVASVHSCEYSYIVIYSFDAISAFFQVASLQIDWKQIPVALPVLHLQFRSPCTAVFLFDSGFDVYLLGASRNFSIYLGKISLLNCEQDLCIN